MDTTENKKAFLESASWQILFDILDSLDKRLTVLEAKKESSVVTGSTVVDASTVTFHE